MTTEIDFSFKTLNAAAQRHIRVFQIHQFLDRFAMGLTVAIVVLALTDRGMDLVQISFLFAVYSLTTMSMELPFGSLADSVGRKPVFLAAVAASLISLALFISTRDFYVLAVSFAFIGFGRALRSGTLDAWFVETFKTTAPNVDVQPALAKAQFANALGLAVGAIVGGLLPDTAGEFAESYGFGIYDVSYAASLCVMVGVFVFTMFAIVEKPLQGNVTDLLRGTSSVPTAIRDASLLALNHPSLPILLAASAFFLMATNPVEVIWPTHARPMLDEGYATSVIGVITATYFFSIAFGAYLSPYINRIFRRSHAMTLAAAFACLAGVQIALALQGSITGFAALLVLYSVVLGVTETPVSSILHRQVDDHQRSTMLSLRSLIQQLGAAVGLVVAGTVAETYSTPVAWVLGAMFLFIAAILSLVVNRRLAAENT